MSSVQNTVAPAHKCAIFSKFVMAASIGSEVVDTPGVRHYAVPSTSFRISIVAPAQIACGYVFIIPAAHNSAFALWGTHFSQAGMQEVKP